MGREAPDTLWVQRHDGVFARRGPARWIDRHGLDDTRAESAAWPSTIGAPRVRDDRGEHFTAVSHHR